jgi:hypothetical protein
VWTPRRWRRTPRYAASNGDDEGERARLFAFDRRAKLVQGYALAPHDHLQRAPCEGVEAEAGAPRADTNVMTDEAVTGLLDGIERAVECLRGAGFGGSHDVDSRISQTRIAAQFIPYRLHVPEKVPALITNSRPVIGFVSLFQ